MVKAPPAIPALSVRRLAPTWISPAVNDGAAIVADAGARVRHKRRFRLTRPTFVTERPERRNTVSPVVYGGGNPGGGNVGASAHNDGKN